jgi:hypothetical protein
VKANTADDAASDESGGDTSGNGETEAVTPKGAPPVIPARTGPPIATLPAFEVLPNGTSIITIHVSGPTQVTEQKSEGRLVYTLSGVAAPERVNRLPLITTSFPTQVSEIRLEQAGTAVNVIVELREATTAKMQTVNEEGGTRITVLVPKSERFGRQKTTSSYDDSDDSDDTEVVRPDGGRGGTSNIEEPTAEEKEANERDEDRISVRRGRRQPTPYVDRPLTLPHLTLSPAAGITIAGVSDIATSVFLAIGARFGIVDDFEVEATPLSFRLDPDAAYIAPSIGLTGRFVATRAFELGGRARFYIPVPEDGLLPDARDNVSGAIVGPDGALLGGFPMVIHGAGYVKVETGIFGGVFFAGDPIGTLSDVSPIPLFPEPGIPLRIALQIDEYGWIGVGSGFGIKDLSQAKDSIFVNLGFDLGITISSSTNPVVDIGARFDWPALYLSSVSEALVDYYTLGFYVRPFFYL